ncbi:MAG: hypothetical protein OHK0039_17490 [Bacteroidia bacterium]
MHLLFFTHLGSDFVKIPLRSHIPISYRLWAGRFSWLYILLALPELAIRALDQPTVLHYLAKPLPMLALIACYAWQRRPQRSDTLLGLGLICSLAGDVLLMFEGYFLGGLVAFLLAHLAYIGAFATEVPTTRLRSVLLRKPWLSLPAVGYAWMLLSLLYPTLITELVWPVTIYSMVLLAMVLAALHRWRRMPDPSFAGVFGGALLFLLSDSLLAVDRFAQSVLPIPLAGVWIMLTYYAAQYFITLGMLLHGQMRQQEPHTLRP